jgi:polysaccharide export outer membrane protein
MIRPTVLLALLATCCVATPAAANPAAPSAPAAAPVRAPVAPAAAADGVDAERYVIGPGDTLQVFVWRNPELTATVPVLPDGRISTPLVESIQATGKTPSQLARDVEAVLSEFVRSPKVNIIVTNAVSTFSQVKIVGQVLKPQTMPYREGLTVLDVVLQSGGLATYAAGNRARILRKEDGRDVEIKVKLQNLIEKGDFRQNLPMRPGDVLIVPQSIL